jgi:hypothetical protein
MKENEPEQTSFNLDKNSGEPSSPGDIVISNGETFEWISHPAKKNKYITILVSIFIVILVFLVYMMTFSVWFSILGFIILYGSLSSFYFPTRYKFTEEEIIVKTTMQTLHKKWSQYRSYYPDKNGVLLSPFIRPTRLENFRGIYIRFWNNRDEVIAFVKRKMAQLRPDDKGI